jgi:tRNA A-37 threonylcarbamoyl transferase component Bud32
MEHFMADFDTRLVDAAYQHIAQQPLPLTSSFYYNNKLLWIKRRPKSKKTIWHQLQYALTAIIRLPIFYPTVSIGGAKSLEQESIRLHLWATRSILVPTVEIITADFLITQSVGVQLHNYLSGLQSVSEKQILLCQAASALNKVHCANLCHGRPSLKDMTYHDGNIFFIDLEEEPLSIMNLAQAQARDIWLFLTSAANHAEMSVLITVFNGYYQNISNTTIDALKQMTFVLKPLRHIVSRLPMKLKGRDIRCAITANKVLEQVLLAKRR